MVLTAAMTRLARARSGEVSLDPHYPVTYQTKVMTAAVAPVPVVDVTPKPKRKYTRRKKTA